MLAGPHPRSLSPGDFAPRSGRRRCCWFLASGSVTICQWTSGRYPPAAAKRSTFGTTGPLLFLEVEGKGPGEEIAPAASDRRELRVKVEAVSIAPPEKLEVIVNGRVAATATPADPQKISFSGSVAVPAGGWIAARVVGPASRYVSDSYAFAQTSPVYVVREGKPFTSAEDAIFLRDVVDAIRARVDSQQTRWRTTAEREKFKAAIEQARAVYDAIAKR